MKGERVRLNNSFPLPVSWAKDGVVLAESERCLGVKLDEVDTPVLVRREYVRVLTPVT